MAKNNKFNYKLFDEFIETFIVNNKDTLTDSELIFTEDNLSEVINALNGKESGDGGSNYQNIITRLKIEEKILLLHAYWLWYYPFNIDFKQKQKFFNDIKLKSKFMFSKDYHLASPGTLGSRTNGKNGEILWLLINVFQKFMFNNSITDSKTFKKQYVEIFKNKKDGIGIRNMLLHLCDRKNYEPIAYNNHKEWIINSYKKDYPGIEKMGCDDAIKEIKEKALKPKGINDFYDESIRVKWDKELNQSKESGKEDGVNNEEIDKMGKKRGNLTCNSKPSLNLILYGPPGTGKTYHTVNKALEILLSEQERNQIFGESDLEKVERETLENKFKELKDKEKRIVFTTFHQSMSYEDFIEGIKPITSDDGKVTYEVKPGIFKQICERANLLAQNNFQKAWGNFKNDLKNDLKTQREIVIKPPKGRTFNQFKIELCQNNTSVRDINDHSKTLNFNRAYEVYTGGTVYYQSYYEGLLELLKDKYNLKDYKAPVDNSEETSNKQEMEQDSEPYVLIIDEINRGNVANIFGELITLIEDDKRGKLSVKLPYSNEDFSVPKNLYIIGTMNTADRSVEALDTALRRRFSFEEMMPDYNLDELKTNVGSYELHKILKTINTRIEVLKDRDHLIGHSYFIGITTEEQLKSAFFDKVIPLLQEYFYGDYEKIQMILGDGFVVKDGDVENATFASNNSTIDRPIVAYKIADKNTIDLNNALGKLMLSTD